MDFNKTLYNEIMETLVADKEYITEAARAFRWDMEQGLKNTEYSSLQMLPSFIGLPKGTETGEFLTLDFGGTNVRATVIRLLGNGRYEQVRRAEKTLVCDEYNLICAQATCDELFDFLTRIIGEAIAGDKETTYFLGHTFSFGSQQLDINKARLIKWAKEFAVPGVEGQDINALLMKALQKAGYSNVKPVAIINDTVAVQLAAAYRYPDTQIGSIYATGHNTCYMERMPDVGRPACILNMESGGFAKLIPTQWDIELDKRSEQPGRQRLEKMVSGRYMGMLFNQLLMQLFSLDKSPNLSAVDMSAIMEDKSAVITLLPDIIGVMDDDLTEKVKSLAKAITVRSARLVAATWAGTLWHLAGNDKILPQHIAVDGSVYQHMPYVQENVRRALYEILGEDAAAIEPVLIKDGSSVGAAIAAAVASKL
ncbi:hexokinase [uncultured Anaerovibrio sp.]|uniref:hexokinase n=1 Tax=uncultured Anaerovibrio sp. TaxID=361586 RepID=UPI0025E1AE6C|nr:hexokinase [uncultured Anaerovibrio sp.]